MQTKKRKKNITNINVIKIYNKILNNESLTNKEIELFESVYSYLILNEIDIDNEILHKYCKTYIKTEEYSYIDRMILLCKDLLNTLNKEYNKNYKLKFFNKRSFNSSGYIIFTEKENIIYININYFTKMYKESKKLPYKPIKTMVFNKIFSILHEFKHLLQKEYISNNDNKITENFIEEEYIKTYNYKFYLKNHNYFKTEREANLFAYENILKYFEMYFDKDIIFEKEMKEKYYKKTNLSSSTTNFKIEFLKKIKKYLENYPYEYIKLKEHLKTK